MNEKAARIGLLYHMERLIYIKYHKELLGALFCVYEQMAIVEVGMTLTECLWHCEMYYGIGYFM